MSRYHGPQGEGAARKVRAQKRTEAEGRNAATSWDRRRSSYWIGYADGCRIGYTADGKAMSVEHAGPDHDPTEHNFTDRPAWGGAA